MISMALRLLGFGLEKGVEGISAGERDTVKGIAKTRSPRRKSHKHRTAQFSPSLSAASVSPLAHLPPLGEALAKIRATHARIAEKADRLKSNSIAMPRDEPLSFNPGNQEL